MKQHFRKLTAILAMVATILLPVGVYAATSSANTVINANIGSTISITTSGNIDIGVTPVAGGAQSSAEDTVTVATNNATGYNLSLEDADADTNLVNGSNTIGAHAGDFATPTALANNSWGYRVDGVGGFGAGPTTALDNVTSSTQVFAGVPANGSSQQLKTTASPTAGDVTTVWYSVKADTSKPNGAYTNTVTYTAVTNP